MATIGIGVFLFGRHLLRMTDETNKDGKSS